MALSSPIRSHLSIVLLLVLAAGLACRSSTSPEHEPADFALVRRAAQELPIVVGDVGGRRTELVRGFLSFETLVGRGAVTGYFDFRITESGTAPRTERSQITGSSVRRGRQIEVHFESGASETFAVENRGTALSTIAWTVPPGVPGLSVLYIYHYERVLLPQAATS